jgi:hypothetical protein
MWVQVETDDCTDVVLANELERYDISNIGTDVGW